MLLTTYLSDFIKKNKGIASVNLILMVSLPLTDIVLPHLYSKFITSIQEGNQLLTSRYAIYIISVFAIVQFLSVVYDWYDANITPRFQGYLTLNMVRDIMDKYDQEYKDITTGSLIARFSKIPELINSWFGSFKDYIIPYFFTFTGVFLYFFKHDRMIGSMFLFTLLLIFYNIHSAFNNCRESARCATESQSELYEEVEDVINNSLTIFTLEKKQQELDRLDKVKVRFEEKYKDTVMCSMKLKSYSFVMLTIFFVFLIYRIMYLVNTKQMEPATTIALFMMFTSILNGMIWVIDIVRDMIRDWSIIVETEGFLETPEDPLKVPSLPVSPPYPDGIGMWNVAFSYPEATRQILKSINFHINKGERVAIIGENGMGKSTILKLILRLYAPNDGGVYIDGMWYQTIDKSILRKKIGYIPQNTMLFNRSILENIQYGNEGVSREQVEELITKLGLSDEFKNLDKNVGKYGHSISGGQRQLVWMLRIMIRNPDYIILDEPTNSLDQQTKELLIHMLNQISPEQTIIAITHDPSFVDYFPRKIRIHDGYAVE